MLIRQDDDHALLELHDGATGQPVLLRQKFMIVAFRAGSEKQTKITLDGHGQNHVHYVKEQPSEIKGPFAQIGNLAFNPDYFLSFGTNTQDDRERFPFVYWLRGNPVIRFSTSYTAEKIAEAIQQARMPRL